MPQKPVLSDISKTNTLCTMQIVTHTIIKTLSRQSKHTFLKGSSVATAACSQFSFHSCNKRNKIFISLFLRGGVPSPNFLKFFTILWKLYTTDNFYAFKVLYMTYL